MGLFGMTVAYLAFSVVHFVQFALAITVCGLYGVDLSRAAKAGKYQDSKWVGLPVRTLQLWSMACANVMFALA